MDGARPCGLFIPFLYLWWWWYLALVFDLFSLMPIFFFLLVVLFFTVRERLDLNGYFVTSCVGEADQSGLWLDTEAAAGVHVRG